MTMKNELAGWIPTLTQCEFALEWRQYGEAARNYLRKPFQGDTEELRGRNGILPHSPLKPLVNIGPDADGDFTISVWK